MWFWIIVGAVILICAIISSILSIRSRSQKKFKNAPAEQRQAYREFQQKVDKGRSAGKGFF
jgi:uncharacterized protein YpmB